MIARTKDLEQVIPTWGRSMSLQRDGREEIGFRELQSAREGKERNVDREDRRVKRNQVKNERATCVDGSTGSTDQRSTGSGGVKLTRVLSRTFVGGSPLQRCNVARMDRMILKELLSGSH